MRTAKLGALCSTGHSRGDQPKMALHRVCRTSEQLRKTAIQQKLLRHCMPVCIVSFLMQNPAHRVDSAFMRSSRRLFLQLSSHRLHREVLLFLHASFQLVQLIDCQAQAWTTRLKQDLLKVILKPVYKLQLLTRSVQFY